jgi:hypothetical protein
LQSKLQSAEKRKKEIEEEVKTKLLEKKVNECEKQESVLKFKVMLNNIKIPADLA